MQFRKERREDGTKVSTRIGGELCSGVSVVLFFLVLRHPLVNTLFAPFSSSRHILLWRRIFSLRRLLLWRRISSSTSILLWRCAFLLHRHILLWRRILFFLNVVSSYGGDSSILSLNDLLYILAFLLRTQLFPRCSANSSSLPHDDSSSSHAR